MNLVEFLSIVIGIVGIVYSAGQLWGLGANPLHKRSTLHWMFWLSLVLVIATIVENSLS